MANDPKNPKNDSGVKPGDVVPGPTDDGKRSGRVSFDSRGNSVWEWQLETGVYSRDVNTQKLKKLDLGDLSIAETGILKQPPGLGEDVIRGYRRAWRRGAPALLRGRATAWG